MQNLFIKLNIEEAITDTLEYLESKGFEVVERVPFELLGEII